ncbi:MAG: internal scaffolding protein [Microvirus sp.]|nr:MAG: internal scaffolding protein [Microvirus sp.]
MKQLTLNFYSRYMPPHHEGEINNEPSLTQQHFANETDINQIMAKFLKTGLLNQIDAGYYEDVSEAQDYRHALHVLKDADAQFATLPALVRKKFNNSPLEFMNFIHDPKNENTARELGLLMTQNGPILNLNPDAQNQPQTPQ